MTELRPVSLNKRQQNKEAFSKNIVSSASFCFQDGNYAYATRQGI